MTNQTKESGLSESRLSAFATANKNVLDFLVARISSHFGPPPLLKRRIVAVAGPGCVGKSTLAEVLSELLSERLSYDSDWVDLDGYLIEKAERETTERIVTGYNPAGFELEKAEEDLNGWLLAGRPFLLRVYDKVASERKATRLVRARELLVVEGVCAFHETLLPVSDFRIFLNATKEVQYTNRQERERNDMGRSPEQIEEKFKHLYPDYLRYIAPKKQFADVVLTVNQNYRLTVGE